MAIEAECTLRVGKKASSGKAQLVRDKLLFEGDVRLEVPFERIRALSVDGPALAVTADEEVRFELGEPVARLWMQFIKGARGMLEKLEVGPESQVAVVGISDPVLLAALREGAGSVSEGRVPERAPVIVLGADTTDALRKVSVVRGRLAEVGVLWIVRSKTGRDVSEAHVREAIAEVGMVEERVVAVSKAQVAHKCVIPPELRGQARRRPPIVSVPPPAPPARSAAASTGKGSSGHDK